MRVPRTLPHTLARALARTVTGTAAGALLFVVSGCGSDAPSAATSTPASATTAASGTPVTPPSNAPVLSSDIPLVSLPPYDSADIPSVPAPVDSSDVPIIITVTVGVDSAVDRIESVPFGSTVALTIVNPDVDDEFHLHGYDFGDGQKVPAGQSETFTFTANKSGEFEVESHATDTVLMILKVG
jgi:hypothetical protein